MIEKLKRNWITIFVLIFVGFLLSLIFSVNSDISPSVLSHYQKIESFKNEPGILSGSFKAQDNYLGIVTLNIENANKLMGVSVFKIKDITQSSWHHISTIPVTQYIDMSQYSFGFPVISDSKNRTYLFELSIEDKSFKSNYLFLNSTYPVLITRYQYPSDILVNNKATAAAFIYKKVLYYIQSKSLWIVLFVYELPALLFLIYIFFGRVNLISVFFTSLRNILIPKISPYILLFYFCIFIDVFTFRNYSETLVILLSFFWILALLVYNLDSIYSYKLSFLFLILYPLFSFAGMRWIADKSMIWMYVFLGIGISQEFVELFMQRYHKEDNHLSVIKYLGKVIYFFDLVIINCINKIKSFLQSSPKIIMKKLIICIAFSILCFLIFSLCVRVLSIRDRQLKNPKIPLIEPSFIYPGTKVVLYGDRFGDRTSRLMNNGKRVQLDYWEDHKIIFTVPLDWKPGPMNLWIEKPVEWNGETIIEKTKPVQIKLLEVTGKFTPEDDLYFEEMKKWRNETKEINGYK